MVHLTRINNQPVVVNSDLIKFVEQAPDTLITLLNGEKFIVRETADEVVGRIVEFRRSVLRGMLPASGSTVPGTFGLEPEASKDEDEANE